MVASLPAVLELRPRTAREVEVDPALIAMLDARAPLTVVRGPRGYGKSTLLGAWLATGGPGHAVVSLALTREANDAAEFWAGVAGALEAAGVLQQERAVAGPAPAGDTDRLRVLGALGARRTPLTIVLDSYHHAGRRDAAAEIDDDLVELVRQNDQLYLVVATRTMRLLETSGSLSVDATIISPQNLRLDAVAVAALARRLGVPISGRDAGRLADGFGGWPAAVRDVLVRSRTEGGQVNLALADEYIASMVRDLRHEAVRSFLLRAAVPEEFDAEVAQLLAPQDTTPQILRNVRAAGLLREEIRDGRRAYSFAPIVRQALVRMLAESRPDELREVHRILMDHHARGDDHLRVLVHAVHAGAWETAERVLEQEWHHIVTEEPVVLVAAAQLIPPEVAAAHPRFRVAREDVTGSLPPGGDRPPAPPWRTGDIRGITAEFSPQRTHGRVEPTSVALLQWGVAAVLAGDESAALYAFGRARSRAQEPGGNPTSVRLATVGLAMTHAIYADADIAARWLADPVLAAVNRPDHEDHALVGPWLAQAAALVALDRLDDDLAERVAAMPQRHRRDEVWALSVLVSALHASLDGGPADVARWAANLRAARHYLPRGGLTEMLVRTSEVEVLLAGGLDVAARKAAEDLPVSVVSAATHARLALAAGDHRRAMARARAALEMPGLTQRSVMECWLVVAAAHHALGERVPARAAFVRAVRAGESSGLRRPFLVIPRGVFTALAGADPQVLQMWPAGLAPAPDAVAAGGEELTEILTPRELEVLQALHVHAGAVAVARELGLSVNTAKSHLRSIYHKMRVTNRAEALRRAEELDRSAQPATVAGGSDE
ncbi:LuxR C-terminal-related transcriptional regulator [Georgenia sp. M64]|uniref:LuxR C-terminal-related transcriptional regulator n=1 Tax=Georgenia sp. M64 TaxID=3120520 RepID=UPI0030DE0873